MKRIIIALQVVFLAVLVSPFAFSQDPDMKKQMEKAARLAYKELLKETDKNNDGKISKSEFFAIWKDKKVAEEKYTFWDTDKDGFIGEEEYVKAVLSIQTKRKK